MSESEKRESANDGAELRRDAAGRHTGGRLRLAVVAAMLVFAGFGQGVAQSPAKAAADQHAAAIRAQLPTAFRLASTTGSVSELQNHIVVNSTGAIYSVRKSNVLIASYSTQNAPDDSGDTSVTNTSGRWVPVSKKCRYTTAVSLPDFATAPVTDACRRDLAMGRARLIASGQRVLLAGVDVYVDKDRAEFLLLEYHKPKGVLSPRFVSQFAVQFPAGFLMTADAAQIAAAIKPFLAPSDDQGLMSRPYLADAPPPVYTLEDNLAAAYSGTAYQLETGTSGQGAVLKVKADRFMRAIPQAMPAIGCTPVLRDGRAKDPGFLCKSMAQNSVYMQPSDNLIVKVVKLESKKDKDLVHLELIDTTQTDPNPQVNGGTGHYHGAVDIEFQKASLGNGDVAKVNEQIAAAFTVTGLGSVGGAAIAGAAADGGGPVAPAAPLNTVAVPTVAAPPQTLEEQLKTLYKLTTVGDGAIVVSRGTALTVTSDKLLLGTPYAKPAMCAASVVDGTAKPPAAACVTPLRPAITRHEAAYFAKGQKLDVVSIAVDVAKETVAFGLIDDGSAAGGPNAAPKFHTLVNFVFPKGYLESSDAGQVGALVNSVLEIPAGQV